MKKHGVCSQHYIVYYMLSRDNLSRKVFFPVLDRMLEELENRFSEVRETIIMGIHACHPASEQFLNEKALKHLAEHYSIHLQPEEITVAKHFLHRKDKKKKKKTLFPASVFSLLDGDMFPSLMAIFQTSLIIPVRRKVWTVK